MGFNLGFKGLIQSSNVEMVNYYLSSYYQIFTLQSPLKTDTSLNKLHILPTVFCKSNPPATTANTRREEKQQLQQSFNWQGHAERMLLSAQTDWARLFKCRKISHAATQYVIEQRQKDYSVCKNIYFHY